jgi:hypothetical protein
MRDATVPLSGKALRVDDISGKFKTPVDALQNAIDSLLGLTAQTASWKSLLEEPRNTELRRDVPYVLHALAAQDKFSSFGIRIALAIGP